MYPTTLSLSTVEVISFVIIASIWLTFTIYFLRWFTERIVKERIDRTLNR